MHRQLQQAIELHRQGHLLRARSIYEKILRVQPGHFDALHLSGVIAAQMNDPARAVTQIGKALKINPGSAAALCNHGNALRELGQPESALDSYDRAIAINPMHADAYLNRSVVQRELGQWDAALSSCEHAIAILPGCAEAYLARGKVQRELRQWDAAAASYEQAIALNPRLADAHSELGIARKELKQHQAALASYEQAVALDPQHFHAHLNIGNLFKDTRQFDPALACFDRAISIKPDFATAYCNRSTIRLLRGEFEQGWSDYEWRWKDKFSTVIRQKRSYPQPIWRGGKSVAGKTILLHHEQGFGDTLQFCRYASLVASMGAKVILEVPQPLCRLLASLEGVSAVVAEGEPLPKFDCYCPMMSLPLAFKTTLATVPAGVPYVRSPSDVIGDWQTRLGEKRRLRVGLVWSGGFRVTQPEVWAVHNRRNIPLAKLAPLNNPHIEFFSLQKGEPAESELAALVAQQWNGPYIMDWTNLLNDFADTAALIEQLDLVISVDTAIAHLAGALAKPVWLLNRFDTCWRWLLDRTDSPWYPTLRLYRQTEIGSWDPVIERVREDLVREIGLRACGK